MSYRDPQQVIDNRIGIVSQGVAQLLGDTTKRLDAYAAQQQKERAAYKKAMDKTIGAAKNRARKGFDNAQKGSDAFTSGLYGESGEQTKDAVSFDEQITGILGNWGTELNTKISEVQAAGGGEYEIEALTNDYIGKMNKFTTDMANWEAARSEYMKAKQAGLEGGANSVGSLLSDPELQRNPELIAMFNAMTDDELDNLYITVDPSGSTRISMGTITDGKFDAQSTSDISAWAKKHEDSPDGKYFVTNAKFDAADYNSMEAVLKDIEGNKELQVNGALDRDLVREYLLEGDVGKTFMNGFLDGNSVSKWASLYPSDEISKQYTDDDYLGLIFDNTWDNIYSPKQKKTSSSKTGKGGPSSSSKTDDQNRKKLITTVEEDPINYDYIEKELVELRKKQQQLGENLEDLDEGKKFQERIKVIEGILKNKKSTKEEKEKGKGKGDTKNQLKKELEYLLRELESGYKIDRVKIKSRVKEIREKLK